MRKNDSALRIAREIVFTTGYDLGRYCSSVLVRRIAKALREEQERTRMAESAVKAVRMLFGEQEINERARAFNAHKPGRKHV